MSRCTHQQKWTLARCRTDNFKVTPDTGKSICSPVERHLFLRAESFVDCGEIGLDVGKAIWESAPFGVFQQSLAAQLTFYS